MKMLSSEVKTLLDKLYNLRGEDSVILAKMNKEREEAIETGERTKNEKEVLLSKIDKLTKEEETLQEEGNKLTSILSNINRDDFAINEKITNMLPETIEKVVIENKKASEELESVETEMNNAITKVEELGIRKDEALSNQAKLNEYFALALEGNINITRDAITSLLEKFDFNEDEQREAAKILMFPEDALYEYDASFKSGSQTSGKTITEVLMEAKKESKPEVKEKIVEKEEVKDENLKQALEEPSSLENIFESVINENNVPEIEDVKKDVIEPVVEPTKEVKPLFSENNKDSVQLKETKEDKDTLKELLTSLEINLSDENIEKLRNDYNEELITKNIEILKNHNIDLSVLNENVEILNDTELNEKLEKLISVGKESRDISLMPSVLVKYDLKGLNNTISVLQISGLDPKKVPLMAY